MPLLPPRHERNYAVLPFRVLDDTEDIGPIEAYWRGAAAALNAIEAIATTNDSDAPWPDACDEVWRFLKPNRRVPPR